MLKVIFALLVAPSLAFAAGEFNGNLGTYDIKARHATRSEGTPEPMNAGTLEIAERYKNGRRYITYKVLDANGDFQEGGPLLTSGASVGDRSFRCEERANIINCSSSAGWSISAIAKLENGRTILSLFNGENFYPETIWELKRR